MPIVTLPNASSVAGDAFVHWRSPVDGLLLAAFVGDPDPAMAVKNFGSDGDLTMIGLPPAEGGCWRRFDLANYMVTQTYRRAGAMTIGAVAKKPLADTIGITLLSSERTHPGDGRRGLYTWIDAPATGASRSGIGGANSTHGNDNISSNTTDAVHDARMHAAVTTLNDGVTSLKIRNITAATGPASAATTASKPVPSSFEAAENEADFPFRVGRSYLTTASSGLIGFVFAADFALTNDQMAALRDSIAPRFAASGETI